MTVWIIFTLARTSTASEPGILAAFQRLPGEQGSRFVNTTYGQEVVSPLVQTLNPNDCEGEAWAVGDPQTPAFVGEQTEDSGPASLDEWSWCEDPARPFPLFVGHLSVQVAPPEGRKLDAVLTEALAPYVGIRKVWEHGFYSVVSKSLVNERLPCSLSGSPSRNSVAPLSATKRHGLDSQEPLLVGWFRADASPWCEVWLDARSDRPRLYSLDSACAVEQSDGRATITGELQLFDMSRRPSQLCEQPPDKTKGPRPHFLVQSTIDIEWRAHPEPARAFWLWVLLGLILVGIAGAAGYRLFKSWNSRSKTAPSGSGSSGFDTTPAMDLRAWIEVLWAELHADRQREFRSLKDDRMGVSRWVMDEHSPGRRLREAFEERMKTPFGGRPPEGWTQALEVIHDSPPFDGKWTDDHWNAALCMVLAGLKSDADPGRGYADVPDALHVVMTFFWDQTPLPDQSARAHDAVPRLLRHFEALQLTDKEPHDSFPQRRSTVVNRPPPDLLDEDEEEDDENTQQLDSAQVARLSQHQEVQEFRTILRNVRQHPKVQELLSKVRRACSEGNLQMILEAEKLLRESDRYLDKVNGSRIRKGSPYHVKWLQRHETLTTGLTDIETFVKAIPVALTGQDFDGAFADLLRTEFQYQPKPRPDLESRGIAIWKELCGRIQDTPRPDEGDSSAKNLLQQIYDRFFLPWFHVAQFMQYSLRNEVPKMRKGTPSDHVGLLNQYVARFGYEFMRIPLYDGERKQSHYAGTDMMQKPTEPRQWYEGLSNAPRFESGTVIWVETPKHIQSPLGYLEPGTFLYLAPQAS
ncbi:MAG: hypothetical protein AAGA48_08605 [Myxococcota bacterium]